MTNKPNTNDFDLLQFAQNRRQFIKTLGTLSISALTARAQASDVNNSVQVEFTHGVASGDPLADRVIIWSRAFSSRVDGFEVFWSVATEPEFANVVASGSVIASAQFDYTLKVDVTHLQPSTLYFYRFFQGTSQSVIGVTRTLPIDQVSHFRLAVVSCSNYVKGYFHAYREIAQQENIHAVIHLGDYIYEYGSTGYVTPGNELLHIPQPRLADLQPKNELKTLGDYRQRYALYRQDADLQELHRRKPFITIWDDHEFANDAWKNGSEVHQNNITEWFTLRGAALQAYYEWLPIREPDSGDKLQSYRSFEIGNLARLILLDTRINARDQQLSMEQLVATYAAKSSNEQYPLDITAQGEVRQLLGDVQRRWLQQELSAAARQQTWQLLGQQVVFALQTAPNTSKTTLITAAKKQLLNLLIDSKYGKGASTRFADIGLQGGPNPLAADSWTGYPSEKMLLAKMLTAVPNPVILSGDSHNAWAANLKLASVPIGVELAGQSVSSPGAEEEVIVLTPDEIAAVSLEASQANSATDDLIYAGIGHRGFMVVDIRPERILGEWYFIDTVLNKTYHASIGKILSVLKDSKQFGQEISATFIDKQLLIPQVEVDGKSNYSAILYLDVSVNGGDLEFVLHSFVQTSTTSTNPAKFSFVTQSLQLPVVDIFGQYYLASMQFIKGSNPMRFNKVKYDKIIKSTSPI